MNQPHRPRPQARPSQAPASRPQVRRRRKQPFPLPLLLLILLIVLVLTIVCVVAVKARDASQAKESDVSESILTESEEEDQTKEQGTLPPDQTEEQTDADPGYQDVTLLSAGDIMFHYDNVQSGKNPDGTYDYRDLFGYLPDLIGKYDYAVANLETVIGGSDLGITVPGIMSFNAPDAALDAIKSAGFDMMLFANNHTYDRSIAGIKRTVSFLEENGMDCIGATNDKTKNAYQIVDIGSVKVGMLNYTEEGRWISGTKGLINGNRLQSDHAEYINMFYLDDLASFYQSVSSDIADLRSKGADVIVFYIHWGKEYELTQNKKQQEIAQKLCDLGVDAIIGSHPHVIQPMEMLTSSTDPNHKTVCFYSLGNFLSNQNRETLPSYGNRIYTENGMMVVLTIRKYDSGEAMIVDIETIPTWVHRYYDENGRLDYRIIPLQDALKDPEAFGLTDSSFGITHATEALAMTGAVFEEALEAFKQSLILPNSPS